MSTPARPDGPLLARPFAGLVDDASALLPEPPRGLHEVTAAHSGRSHPAQGALLVRDTGLPLLRGFPGPVAVVVTGGAGQVGGPVALCRRLGLDLRRLHVALRDPGDLAGNARRVVAAVDDARSDGLDDDCLVHVEVPDEGDGSGPTSWSRQARPTTAWLAAVDELAADDLGLALPLTSPWAAGPGAAEPAATASLLARVDAALDREVPVWFVGATGLTGGPGAGAGVLNALVATRLLLDGEPEDAAAALAEADAAALLARTDPRSLSRVRSWCTAVATSDADLVLGELDAVLSSGTLPAGWAG